jgi:hypothetical protein
VVLTAAVWVLGIVYGGIDIKQQRGPLLRSALLYHRGPLLELVHSSMALNLTT